MDYLIQVGRQGVGVGEAEHIPEGKPREARPVQAREVNISTG